MPGSPAGSGNSVQSNKNGMIHLLAIAYGLDSPRANWVLANASFISSMSIRLAAASPSLKSESAQLVA